MESSDKTCSHKNAYPSALVWVDLLLLIKSVLVKSYAASEAYSRSPDDIRTHIISVDAREKSGPRGIGIHHAGAELEPAKGDSGAKKAIVVCRVRELTSEVKSSKQSTVGTGAHLTDSNSVATLLLAQRVVVIHIPCVLALSVAL